MSIIDSESLFERDSITQRSLIEFLENYAHSSSSSGVTISHPEFTLPENIATTDIATKKDLTNFDENIEEKASIYEIMKNIIQIDKDKCISNCYIIKELTNGCIVFVAYNKKIFLYNNEFNFLFEVKFPYLINSINEVQNNNQNLIEIICCSVFYIYIISFDLISKEKNCIGKSFNSDKENEFNLNDIQNDIKRVYNSETKNYNYIFMLDTKNGQQIFSTNNGVYESDNILNKERKISEIVNEKQYLECISLNDKLICFKSNKQLLNGQDKLIILNLSTKKIISEINGYSFTLYSDRLILLPIDEKGEKKILIASCTKYSNDQKNGILVVNFDFKSEEKVETKAEFLETEYFSINCICYLDDKKNDNNKKDIYFLAGGVDSEYKKGMVKLYKIYEKEGKTCIEFLQEVLSEENFEGAISCIHQLNNGKIIISAGNGNILFSSPNLDGYKEDDF